MKSDSLCKKVSVSLPAGVHKWLIEESEKESQSRGSRVTVSSLIQETLNELKKKKSDISLQKKPSKPSKVFPAVGATMATLSENLDSGQSTATKKHSRRAS
jgi:hypothetical protein